jgi:dipeptidyl aminopeptidase/acylaminoacyl peptidase
VKWALAASALALVVVPVSHTAAPASGTIVFSSTRAAYFHDEVVVLDPVTGARRNLSDSPSSDRDPAVSPDGRRVAFVTDRGGGEAVWVVGVDGSGLRRVTAEYADGPGAASVLSRPTWRADGRWLAYVVEQFRVAGSSTQVLYVVPSEGGPSRALARGVSVWGEWAATGERLAVGHYDPSAKEFVVSVMTAGGKLVWRRPGLGAVWSARGELAVTERGRVSVYSSSGGLRARRPGSNVAWQPSGELLAIVRRSGIWVLDGSGGQRRITGSASTFDSPAWSRTAGGCSIATRSTAARWRASTADRRFACGPTSTGTAGLPTDACSSSWSTAAGAWAGSRSSDRRPIGRASRLDCRAT